MKVVDVGVLNDENNGATQNGAENDQSAQHGFEIQNSLISQLPDLACVCRGSQTMSKLYLFVRIRHPSPIDTDLSSSLKKS